MPRPSHLRSVDAVPTSSTAPRPASGRAPSARSRAERSSDPFTAAIVALADDGRLTVAAGGDGAAVTARAARLAGWSPAVGDVVVVLPASPEPIVVAVIEAAAPLALVAPDGAAARLVDGHLEVRDAEGGLLVRSVEGGVEVGPARGDLRLRAPHGRVAIEAGLDVAVEAQRDVVITAARSAETRVGAADGELPSRVRVDGRGTSVSGAKVAVQARESTMTAGVHAVVARELRTSATRIETVATHVETTGERIVVRARDVVEEVADLLETKVGRVRTLVRGVFSLRARSTTMKSKDDTAIDGRRVLLG